MKPLFSLHAGEIVAGQHIEHSYRNVNVWVPTKDTGVDILVTDRTNKNGVSLQVKYSKHFESGLNDAKLERGLRACGWWTLTRKKIKDSTADYWIFAIRGLDSKEFDFIIIPPTELLRRLDTIYPNKLSTCHTYLWVTNEKKSKCWTTRGLGKVKQSEIALGTFSGHENWDFTQYLNNWTPIKELNG